MADEPRWRRYLRFWGADARADVEDELSFHVSERARLNEALGLPPDRAREEAERSFGDVERIREELVQDSLRDARRMTVRDGLGDVVRDIRLAARSLARERLYTVAAGTALALGIGASAAVFAVVSAVLLRPLPYADPERVVTVHNSWDGAPEAGISPAEYLDLAAQTRAFSAFGVYADTWVSLIDGDVAERVPAAILTPGTFGALGLAPAVGRLFDGSDGVPGADDVVMLSHEFWQARFNGARDVIGRSVIVSGTAMTIVGVLPADVRLPSTYADANPPVLFAPYALDPASVTARGSHFLDGVARLAPGWTVESATGEVSRVAQEMVARYPDDYPTDMRFDTFVRPVHADVAGESRRLLLVLSGAVLLVLLIACANVSSLVLTRTEDRRRELAVRSALGADRNRIVRQLLLEHLVLAVASAAAGLLLARLAVQTLIALQPEIPRLAEARVGFDVVLFTAGVAVVSTLLVALAPLRLGIVSHGALREAGSRTTAARGSQRVRRTLIVTEVALSIVLVAGAGLLIRSFANLAGVDPGYRTDDLLTVPISLPSSDYPDDDSRRRFFAQLVTSSQQLPGVDAAGAVSNLPLATTVGDLNIMLEGQPVAEGDVSPRLDWQVVTPGWLETMGIDVIRGRGITAIDDARATGAVVLSESAARRYWPDTDPIGRRFRLGGNAGPGWVTVVGIVEDVRHATLADEPPAIMYLPHAQFTFWNGGSALSALTLVLHTNGDPLALLGPLRELVRRMDPRVPLGAAQTMAQVRSTALGEPRFATSVLGTFAGIALLLAVIGVYGLVAWTVTRRTREIALRMALGADARTVVRQIIRQGMAPVLAGIVIGTAATVALSRTLRHILYDVAPNDPATITVTLLLLAVTALVACALPARRATRIAPHSALAE